MFLKFFISIEQIDSFDKKLWVDSFEKVGNKWMEGTAFGKPPSNWAKAQYDANFEPSEIVSLVRETYGPKYNISGPFYSLEEAIQ